MLGSSVEAYYNDIQDILAERYLKPLNSKESDSKT